MDKSLISAVSFMQPRKSMNFSTALAMAQEIDVQVYVEDLVSSMNNSYNQILHYEEKIQGFQNMHTQNLYFLLADLKEAASLISTIAYLVNLSECYLKTAHNLNELLEHSNDE